ncbi:Lebercilin domain containing protein [Asbolus verrucosus]|uniref:Lebercilin domain containing protein n=1 Tax=Asbolus verrucosus TaxID=1661398 RepID=A0A482VUW1_ASBVE|nr:Lebercilin domain containing protein [Asbolus verrucosus]
MWNMMCDVMPTISEDSISQRSSQFSGEDANFEQLMVSMLDERDKLMDSLRETQERLGETEMKLADVEKERDSLQRQIAANLPQVRRVEDSNAIFMKKLLLFLRLFTTTTLVSSDHPGDGPYMYELTIAMGSITPPLMVSSTSSLNAVVEFQ